MPKIQRFISERLPPGTSGGVPVSPQMVGMEAGAIARAGEKIEQTGLYAANVFAIQAERDKRAEEANIAGKIKIGLENDKDILLESWKENEDYQNSEKSVDEWVKNARQKYEPMSKLKDGGESETLAQGIDLYISHTTNNLKKLARDRYREGLTRETKANWLTQKDFYIRDYANATTPEEKTIVRNNMEIEARELGRRMILWPEEVEKEVKSFGGLTSDVEADKAILRNSIQAFTNFHDPLYLPELSEKNRMDKIEKAGMKIRQLNVDRKTEEVEIEKIQKKMRDNFRTEIDFAIMGGKDISEMLILGKRLGIVDHESVTGAIGFQRSWNEALKRVEKEENPTVKAKLQFGLYGSNLITTEKDLITALSSGDINTSTFQTFLGHRTSRIEKKIGEDYKTGEESLKIKFTMTGPGSAIIDREANTLKANALVEYYGLVHNKENPIHPTDAITMIEQRYLPVLDGIKNRESKKLRQALVIPNNQTFSIEEMSKWLLENKNKMPLATYQTQIRMLMDIDGLERSQQKLPTPSTPEEGKKKKYKVTRE